MEEKKGTNYSHLKGLSVYQSKAVVGPLVLSKKGRRSGRGMKIVAAISSPSKQIFEFEICGFMCVLCEE